MSRYISNTLRDEIISRDLGLCRYCGGMPMKHEIEIDHVVPYAIGGPTAISNLVTSCRDCNRDKGEETWYPIPIGQTYARNRSAVLGSTNPVEKKRSRTKAEVGKSRSNEEVFGKAKERQLASDKAWQKEQERRRNRRAKVKQKQKAKQETKPKATHNGGGRKEIVINRDVVPVFEFNDDMKELIEKAKANPSAERELREAVKQASNKDRRRLLKAIEKHSK